MLTQDLMRYIQIGLLDANLCSPSIPIFFQLDGRKDQVRIEKSKGS